MASPLAKMQKQIAKGFRGKLKTGKIRVVVSDDGVPDDYGDSTPSETMLEATFDGIQENFNAMWAAQAGIPETDVSVMIIMGSIKPRTIVPAQDSLIFIENQWLRVRRVLGTDPANATMRLQCFVEAPQPEQ